MSIEWVPPPWCTSSTNTFCKYSLQSQWSGPFTKRFKNSTLYHIHKRIPENLAQFTLLFIHNSHLTTNCQHYRDRGQYASIKAGSLCMNFNKFIYYFMLLIPIKDFPKTYFSTQEWEESILLSVIGQKAIPKCSSTFNKVSNFLANC